MTQSIQSFPWRYKWELDFIYIVSVCVCVCVVVFPLSNFTLITVVEWLVNHR